DVLARLRRQVAAVDDQHGVASDHHQAVAVGEFVGSVGVADGVHAVGEPLHRALVGGGGVREGGAGQQQDGGGGELHAAGGTSPETAILVPSCASSAPKWRAPSAAMSTASSTCARSVCSGTPRGWRARIVHHT